MISANRKIISVTIIIACLIFFIDVIFDSVLWVLHISFEIIEFYLDELVEYLFQLEHHNSEIIGLYIFLGIILIIVYRTVRGVPGFFRRLKKKLAYFWQSRKKRFSVFWIHLSLIEKIKLILVCTTCFTSLLFLLTL